MNQPKWCFKCARHVPEELGRESKLWDSAGRYKTVFICNSCRSAAMAVRAQREKEEGLPRGAET